MRWTALVVVLSACCPAADIRVGIIGTDTSHAVEFTRILNNASDPEHVPGARVVAAYKGGSPDIGQSANRIEKFTSELQQKYSIEIVPDIPALLSRVDAVLLLSVDGRKHLEQVRPVFAAHKPVFIDKPLASTMSDVREIAKLGSESGTPWFSASSLRFSEIATKMHFADARGAITWGPGPEEEHHQLDLSWYAVHPIELLFTLLGPGCETVTRTVGADEDDITCRWEDGRIGSVRTLRPYGHYGAVVFRPDSVVQSDESMKAGYSPLITEIVKFFQTGKPPVSNAETVEIFAFMDAAQKSKANGGGPVKEQ